MLKSARRADAFVRVVVVRSFRRIVRFTNRVPTPRALFRYGNANDAGMKK